MRQTGLNLKKIMNWFMNVRKRIWKPVMKKSEDKNFKNMLFKIKLKLENEISEDTISEKTEKPKLLD